MSAHDDSSAGPILFKKKMQTTSDINNEHLTVPFREPVPLKTRTTHDAATEQLTVEYPSIRVGDYQFHGGRVWQWDGQMWCIVAPKEPGVSSP